MELSAKLAIYYNNQFIELIPDESLSSATVHSNATNQFVSKSYHTKDAEGIKVLPKIISLIPQHFDLTLFISS